MNQTLRAAALSCLAALPVAAQELPRLNLVPGATTVSGLSSGAYMAGQFHVAHSAAIAGAALLAGGPYGCAEGRLLTALGDCMDSDADGPDLAPLLEAARQSAAAGEIDPLAGVPEDRVFLFTGSSDETVAPAVTRAAAGFYRSLGIDGPALALLDGSDAGHGFPAPGGPVPCAETRSPYINDCGIDGAGLLLAHLLPGGPDSPGTEDTAALVAFSQEPFLADISDHGLAATGYAYIPAACRAGRSCRLHIAFHGCHQGAEEIGEAFVRGTGYNRWAEAMDLVILYPQIRASLADGNPNGCWDWWGYDDADHAGRTGPQMLAVARMAEALGVDVNGPAPLCVSHEGWAWQHAAEGRAEPCGLFAFCAVGSGAGLGPWFLPVTLFEAPDGSFHPDACPV